MFAFCSRWVEGLWLRKGVYPFLGSFNKSHPPEGLKQQKFILSRFWGTCRKSRSCSLGTFRGILPASSGSGVVCSPGVPWPVDTPLPSLPVVMGRLPRGCVSPLPTGTKSRGIRAHLSPVWPHLTLVASAKKTVFPNKVTLVAPWGYDFNVAFWEQNWTRGREVGGVWFLQPCEPC